MARCTLRMVEGPCALSVHRIFCSLGLIIICALRTPLIHSHPMHKYPIRIQLLMHILFDGLMCVRWNTVEWLNGIEAEAG